MQSSMARARWVVVAVGLALGGCNGSSEPLAPPVEEQAGLLGNGVFRWSCTTGADPACGTGVFPIMVALNAQFRLEFIPDVDVPDELGVFAIEAVSPRRLADQGGTFTTRIAGDVSVVALGDGFGVDYVSLTLRPVDDLMLGVHEESELCETDYDHDGICDGTGGIVTDPPVTLVDGELTDVRARPLGGGENLAGAIDYEWESLTPELVTIIRVFGRSATLSAHGTGLARISVRTGDYVEVFEYEVQGAPPEPDDTGTDTGGTETGSGSESGSDTGAATGGESGSDTDAATGGESGSDTGAATGSESGDTDGATTTGGV